MMVENLAMSSQAKDVFCIWLVSPLLRKSFFTRCTCNICLVSDKLMKNRFLIIVFQYGSLSRSIFAYNYYVIELQLKDHHQPLRMRMKWPDLLRRFTTASTEMIEKGKKRIFVHVRLFVDLLINFSNENQCLFSIFCVFQMNQY